MLRRRCRDDGAVFARNLHRCGVRVFRRLCINGARALNFEFAQQRIDFGVGQFAALDAGGGRNAFDGGDPPQGQQPFRRQRAQRPPCAFELINLGDERKQRRGNDDSANFQHSRKYSRK